MEKDELSREVERIMQRFELEGWQRQEVEETLSRMERELEEHHKKHLQYMKRSRLIFRSLMALIGVLMITAFLPIFFPSTKQISLYVSSACCFAVSIVNFKQFLDSLSWDKKYWAAILLFLTILNIFNGARIIM